MKNPAGVVFAFRRPDYLGQVLDSLEANEEAYDIPWYAFLDGAVNKISGNRYAEDVDIDMCYQLLLDSPLNFKIKVNDYNKCIARQKHAAHRLYEEHDALYFFEDDMILSPYYLRLLRIALEQFPLHAILLHQDKRKGKLNRLTNCGIARVWGYGMTRELYRKIEEDWNRYHKGISQVDYLLRTSIKDFKKNLDIEWHSHDINITRLSRRHGDGKLWPEISRGYYVGRKGAIAFRTDQTWFKRGMHQQRRRILYPSDAKFAAWNKV